MKNLFLLSFISFFSFSSFSQDSFFSSDTNLVISSLSVITAFNGENDLSDIHRMQDVDLFFIYDSTNQTMVYSIFWRERSSFSSGELIPVEDPSIFDDNPEGKLFFIWSYFNSYNDKSGDALVVISRSVPFHMNNEEIETIYVDVILPGRDDLFYETVVNGENTFFESVALLE